MRIVLLHILLFLVSITQNLNAQKCGCEGEGVCPVPVDTNSTSQVCYTISNVFLDDLANPSQGICGVSIRFRHGSISKLKVRLRSPNGTSVQLIDGGVGCVPPDPATPVAIWDILFVPQSVTSKPDTINLCPYPKIFNTCPSFCNWQNAAYKGTYYPFFLGKLEDFNSGPVNGQWCLDITNTSMTNGGQIFDFEVIVCDQNGYICCKADAGSLASVKDVNACQGDSTLALKAVPKYGAVVPNSNEYGYTYPIFRNDTLIKYDSLANLRNMPPGNYIVCGLSYLRTDSAKLPAIGSPLTPIAFHNNLNGPSPWLCADIDTNSVNVNIAAIPAPFNMVRTICRGNTIRVGTSAYTSSGTYSTILKSVAGCDSLVNLDLTVLPADTIRTSAILCFGETYIFGADTLSSPGMYSRTLTNSYGCDSTIILNLNILAPIETNLTDTICFGNSRVVGPNSYSTTGVYVDTLKSVFNCDSIVTLDLTVAIVGISIQDTDTLTCRKDSVALKATASAYLGIHSYQWTTTDGVFTGSKTGPTAFAKTQGVYTVTVSSFNCSATASRQVYQDRAPPKASAIANSPDTLTCVNTSVHLSGTGSTGIGPFSFRWTSIPIGLLNDSTNLMPSVSLPGTYRLVLTNFGNGCRDTAGVMVSQNITAPIANAGADRMLSCTSPGLNLNGSASSPAGRISYSWITSNGNLQDPVNIAQPFVNAPGTYELVVTNLDNGCRDTDVALVNLDTLAPQAFIIPSGADRLTCSNSSVTLDATSSIMGSSVAYKWEGPIASGQGTLVATATQTGIYSFVLNDTVNGCTDTARFTVAYDTLAPIASAGPDKELTCTALSALLGDTLTDFGPSYALVWSAAPPGSFVNRTDSTHATVTSEAFYYLEVRNLNNGCISRDTVRVINNRQPPIANAGPDVELTCQSAIATLNGFNPLNNSFSVYQWRNPSGQLIDGNSPTVTVNSPGAYALTVIFAFCSSTDTVLVIPNSQLPIVNAGVDTNLGCLTGTVILNGNSSSSGPDYTFLWTTPDGTINSGNNTLAPLVSQKGTYVLSITNTTNSCAAIDTVMVSVDSIGCRPNVNAGADGVINCNNSGLKDTLQASGSSGVVFSYQWTAINGNIIDDSNPFRPVVGPGSFVFKIRNTILGLEATDTVLVVTDTLLPIADAGVARLSLGCSVLNSCFQLDASNSSQGPNYTYLWESLNGSFCSATNVLNARISGAGIYNLGVINRLNGCMANDAVLVELTDVPPTASAGLNIQVLCGDTIVSLNGSLSSSGPDYAYHWFSPSGNVLSGATNTSPMVSTNSTQDTFYLVVTNLINECRDTDQVVVFAPTDCFPTCQVLNSGSITCNLDTVFLSSSGSSAGIDISYLWTALNGTLGGSSNSPGNLTTVPGNYQLTVTRTYPNGAKFNSTCLTQVMDNRQAPIANAGPDVNITCTTLSPVLNGSNSSSAANFTYNWTSANGNIVSGANTRTPTVNAIGDYLIRVTNTQTGCFASDLVTVGRDTLRPIVDAGPSAQISCSTTNVVLSGTSIPMNVNYSWTSPDGNICAGPNSANPVACAAGTYILRVTNQVNGCTAIDSTFVTRSNDFPAVNLGPDLNYTCADTTFVILASASGIGALSYQWTPSNGGCINSPTNILRPSVSCPGTYQLRVTDSSNGCSATSVVNVLKNNLRPVASAGTGTEINCTNPVATLNGGASKSNALGGGTLSYLWSANGTGNILSGQNTSNPLVDSAGLYRLIVTDNVNQCKDTSVVVVTRDANIPVAVAGRDSTLTCSRKSIRLNGTGSSISPPGLVYLWSTSNGNIVQGASALSPTIDRAGLYVLSVINPGNNCTVKDTVRVTMDTIPPVAGISPVLQTIACNNPQVSISGSSSSPIGSLTYNWSTMNGHIAFGGNSANATVDSGGTYILTVTNTRNGCTSSASVFVNQNFQKPAVSINPPLLINCIDSAVSLQVLIPGPDTLYTYLWNGPQVISGANTPNPLVGRAGLYNLTLVNSVNGCQNIGSVLVTENKAPPVAKASVLAILDCVNPVGQILGTGSTAINVRYLWTTRGASIIGDTTAMNTTTNGPGWHYLTVRRLDNGCAATDSVLVISNSLPITNALLTVENPNCINPEGLIRINSVIGGTPPFLYSVNGGVQLTNPLFNYLRSGTYNLRIEDTNGCSWQNTVTLPPPGKVSVELGNDHFIKIGQSVSLQALTNISLPQIDAIIWTGIPDSASCRNCLSQVVSPLETTVYRVTVIDKGGCRSSDVVTVWVNRELDFYIPTAFSPDGNGVNDRLVFHAGKNISKVDVLRIYNRWGNMVFAAQDFPPNDPGYGWDGTFQGNTLNPGVYVWKVELTLPSGNKEVYYGETTIIR